MHRVGLALLILLALAVPARGQPAQATDAARAAYKQAVVDFDAGRYQLALRAFRGVMEQLGGSPNARLYVARCLVQLGRLPEAYEQMALAAREAADRAPSEPRFEPTREAAVEELGEIGARVALVTIVVLKAPPGVAATINERPLEAARLGEAVAVMPGVVQIRLRAPGYQPAERHLTLPAGASETATLTLTRLAPPDPTASRPPPSPAAARGTGGVAAATGPGADSTQGAQEAEGGMGLRGWGLVAAGVGLAGMGVFIGAGVAANGRYDEIEAACGGRSCPDPSHDERIAGGRTLDTVANVGLGVGLAGLLAGTAMILLGGQHEPSSSAQVEAFGNVLAGRWAF